MIFVQFIVALFLCGATGYALKFAYHAIEDRHIAELAARDEREARLKTEQLYIGEHRDKLMFQNLWTVTSQANEDLKARSIVFQDSAEEHQN